MAGLLGIAGSVFFLLIALFLRKEKRNVSKAILFGYLVISSQVFGYFSKYPDAIFETTHRYLSYGLIGYSFLWGGFLYLVLEELKNRKLNKGYVFLPIFLFLTTNLILGFRYQSKIVATRSIPSREFYEDLLASTPKVDKGAIFYFDIKDDAFYQSQFNDFFSVGSMPESTALAIYYDLDRADITYVRDFDELLYILSKRTDRLAAIDNLYTYYYDEKGLVDTTTEVRGALLGEKEVTPASYLLYKISAKVEDELAFTNLSSEEGVSFETKKNFINYLVDKENYYKQVTTAAVSQWRGQEVGYVVDQDIDTAWWGHRIWWYDHRHDRLTVDMGKERLVASVWWVNWRNTLTPTDYLILVSKDNKNWVEVKKVVGGLERQVGEQVRENFVPINARYVAMDITGTVSNDAPAISEFEVVDEKYEKIDISEVQQFINDPFVNVLSDDEYDFLLKNVLRLLDVRLKVFTEKGILESETKIRSLWNKNIY